MKTGKRLLIYVSIIAVIIISSFFWGSPGQSRNMRQARKEISQLKGLLRDDETFSNIKFVQSTANLGRLIGLKGTVANQESFDMLKMLIHENISPKFKIVYSVAIEEQTQKM